MIMSSAFEPLNPRVTTIPISFRLREHHCVSPDDPVSHGGADGRTPMIDDGIANGWFPAGCDFVEKNGTVKVFPGGGKRHRYATFSEGKNLHDETKCWSCVDREDNRIEKMRKRKDRLSRQMQWERENGKQWEEEELVQGQEEELEGEMDERVRVSGEEEVMLGLRSDAEVEEARAIAQKALGDEVLVDDVLRDEMNRAEADSDEDVSDVEERSPTPPPCNGLRDIIVTGEVRLFFSSSSTVMYKPLVQSLPKHSLAWHRFKIYGRIRGWDGLIVLVRTPVDDPTVGVTIFRGYLVANQNFVGNWRPQNGAQVLPLEGPFVASRAPDAE